MKTTDKLMAPVSIPAIPRIDGPAADVVILETMYRRLGLPPHRAITAAWTDYEMFRDPPFTERSLLT
jgi:hypothetical protein